MEFEPKGPGSVLQMSRQNLDIATGRIDECTDNLCRWDDLVQQFQSLRLEFLPQRGHARDVAARSVQAGDQAELHRITPGREDDRDRRGCALCRDCSEHLTGRGNHCHLSTDQVRSQSRQPVVLLLCPAIFDRDVSAFDIAGFGEALAEGAQAAGVPVRQCAAEKADHWHATLLRSSCERQGGGGHRRAAEQGDELPTLHHSITSSASAITVGGTVRPSVVAVLRLMANSNLAGACAGSSAGLAPFKMRSTYEAERRKMSDVSGPYDISPPSLMSCR